VDWSEAGEATVINNPMLMQASVSVYCWPKGENCGAKQRLRGVLSGRFGWI